MHSNELKQAHSLDQLQYPPYNFCSSFENEYLLKLLNETIGRD
jgi:hypothetical protein